MLAITGAGLFSLKGVMIKLGLGWGLEVEPMMFWRQMLALPFYGVVAVLALRRATPETRGHLRSFPTLGKVVVLGALGYYVCTWLDFTGLRYISAQLERMVLFTYPTTTALLAWWWLGERFTGRHAVALVVCYVGIAVVMLGEGREAGGANAVEGLTLDHLKGVGLVLAAATGFATYSVLSTPQIRRVGSRLFTCLGMSAAATCITLHTLLLYGFDPAEMLDPTLLLLSLVMAVFSTVLPSLMMAEALHRLGPGLASAAGNAGPVVTILAATTVLGEAFGPGSSPRAAGAVCILVGVALATRARRAGRDTTP